MDIWIPNTSSHASNDGKGKGKSKNNPDGAQKSYPILRTGVSSPIALQERGGRLEWTKLFQADKPGRKYSLKSPEPAQPLFPPTKSLLYSHYDIPVTKRAELAVRLSHQGRLRFLLTRYKAQTLRTYYPDVDIPMQLLQEHIKSEAAEDTELAKFDPTLGNMMDMLYFETGSSRIGLLAFPMGETGSELSKSSFMRSNQYSC
jgi:hypothetical protein